MGAVSMNVPRLIDCSIQTDFPFSVLKLYIESLYLAQTNLYQNEIKTLFNALWSSSFIHFMWRWRRNI